MKYENFEKAKAICNNIYYHERSLEQLCTIYEMVLKDNYSNCLFTIHVSQQWDDKPAKLGRDFIRNLEAYHKEEIVKLNKELEKL